MYLISKSLYYTGKTEPVILSKTKKQAEKYVRSLGYKYSIKEDYFYNEDLFMLMYIEKIDVL